ncbi:BlaI/MecI/CopY family transcriptional regulator [Porphyromonadaceae bacterium W3.11]|nr:BlaI/MecI/CopY family transcriptional regulator [Porphyromonadaceae bacterium W3.11]
MLTEKEELVLIGIWKSPSPFSIGDIPVNFPYTTTASIVKRLQEKRFVSLVPTSLKQKYLYQVLISKEEYLYFILDHFLLNVYESDKEKFVTLVNKIISVY